MTDKKYVITKEYGGGSYFIAKEERENHPGQHKACLYYNGTKVAVCKEGKIQIKTHLSIPENLLEDLKAEGKKIDEEES